MKYLLIAIVLGVVVVAAVMSRNGQPSDNSQINSSPTSGSTEQSSTQADESKDPEVYTMTEVVMHASRDDCWLVIEDKVYDVTPFIASGNHPGGEAIIAGCGRDATEGFNNRPTDGSAHSARARSMLPNYYIGELAAE